MCGRFNLVSPSQRLLDALGIPIEGGPGEGVPPRYNIAPSQEVWAVRWRAQGGGPECAALRWGLVPSWATDPAIGHRLINARSETAATKPSFRSALRHRRCLVAADGWYEWCRGPGGRQPYLIRRDDGAPLYFAALWERWEGAGESGERLSMESCALLTASAAPAIGFIHARMPVVLDREHHAPWLDPGVDDPGRVSSLLEQRRVGGFEAFPVSPHVNRPQHDDAACIAPLADEPACAVPEGTGGSGRDGVVHR